MKREDKTMDLKGRHFLTLKDFTPEEIIYLLDLAAELKEKKKKGILVDHHRGKNVALIFEKDSTRTRSSFEIAAHDLGMGTTYIGTMGSGRKRASKIRQEYLEECMKESSTEDSDRRLSKSWLSMREYLYGTD